MDAAEFAQLLAAFIALGVPLVGMLAALRAWELVAKMIGAR